MSPRRWSPDEILELSGSYWKICVLHAAVKLDLFTAIGDKTLTDKEIATKIKGSQRGVEKLLNALVAVGLLTKIDDKYANTPSGQSLLAKDSTKYIGHMIIHHHHLMESWSQLDQAILSGRPIESRASCSPEEWRESFLMGMFNMAMRVAPKLVSEINLRSKYHLLDLGGGPGTYAIHFCLNNPQLKATVFDLPATRPFAEKTIAKFGLADQISFMAGNYLKEEIKGHYDVAWLSQILHGEGPDECQNIIRKAISALEPGGLIIIHDLILNNTMDGPLFPALFSLNMLLGTSSGQSYSEKQIMEMLSALGVKDIRRIPLKTQIDSGLISGTV